MSPSALIETNADGLQGFLTEYPNPIIPGFAPDPSVVLVDGTFFLVTSSFHLFPGIPIYTSTDLKQWTHIGMADIGKETNQSELY
jgi:beta-xylosidase